MTITVTDNGSTNGSADPKSGSATLKVTIANVAPVITGMSGPSNPVALGGSASMTTTFTDVGSLDTHSCTYSWDDGTPDTTVTAPGTGNGSCTASHTYASAGVYGVGVTVKDDDTGSATSKYEFVVVYDPNGGFVTGGGWINSPPGAYRADPLLTGKANFGFVSKYKKGASVPEGETEFQFQAGNLNFHSDSYQWLVVAGDSKAQYKGTGHHQRLRQLRLPAHGLRRVAGQVPDQDHGPGRDRLRQQIGELRRHRRRGPAGDRGREHRRPQGVVLEESRSARGAARRPSLVLRSRFGSDGRRTASHQDRCSAGTTTASVAPTATATTPHSVYATPPRRASAAASSPAERSVNPTSFRAPPASRA